jgi:peptidoglycan/LPS O-acetylase OafA/YrhL
LLLFIGFQIPYKVILFPVLFLYIVIFLVYKDEQSERITIFSRLGKYTYGMYMYHPTLILFAKMVFDRFGLAYKESTKIHVLMAFLILGLTIVVSMLSYRIVEKPILSFKSRFASIKTRI